MGTPSFAAALFDRPRLVACDQLLQVAGASLGDGFLVLFADEVDVALLVDVAEDAERLGEVWVAHAAEQERQARLGRFLVVDSRSSLLMSLPDRRLPGSVPCRRMPLSRFLPKISGLPCSS